MSLAEPANLTGWVDRNGDVWVRVDDCPNRKPCDVWWQWMCGPKSRKSLRGGIYRGWHWELTAADFGPFVEASAEDTATAIALVRDL